MSSSRSRRLILKALLAAPAAAALAGGRSARAQQGAQTGQCVTETEDGLPESLHFVALSPHADRACRTCTFWTPDEGAQCGRCAMMLRSTPPTGFCDSWASR